MELIIWEILTAVAILPLIMDAIKLNKTTNNRKEK